MELEFEFRKGYGGLGEKNRIARKLQEIGWLSGVLTHNDDGIIVLFPDPTVKEHIRAIAEKLNLVERQTEIRNDAIIV